MRKLAIMAMFFTGLVSFGCSVDEFTLSQAELDDLVDNFEGAIEAYSELTDFTMNVALGDENIDGYTYDQPSAENGWTGTLSFVGQALPTSTGNMTLTFQVLVDGVPIDPYSENLALDQLATLSVTGAVAYDGVSTAGALLAADGNFSWTGTFEELTNDGTLTLNGVFHIKHNSYDAELVPRDFTFHLDLDTEAISEVSGRVDGSVDIPGFYFDADLRIVGNGLNLDANVDIAGNDFDVSYPISEF